MAYYDCDETDRAVGLYFRWCEMRDRDAAQPNRLITKRKGDVIHIANCSWDLARYRVLPNGRLRKMWPRRV